MMYWISSETYDIIENLELEYFWGLYKTELPRTIRDGLWSEAGTDH